MCRSEALRHVSRRMGLDRIGALDLVAAPTG
jgi:hypothetical protein